MNRKDEIEFRQKLISERTAQFEYIQIASGPDCEVWQCKKPNTGMYGFHIAVTRTGIAVVGDIEGLLFNVGSSYGMEFLAGDDVNYYIHSKLEHQCRKTVFDRDHFKQVMAEVVAERCVAHLETLPRMDDDEEGDYPHWLSGGKEHQKRREDINEVRQFLIEKMTNEPTQPLWLELSDFLGMIGGISELQEVYNLLTDDSFRKLLKCYDWDYDFTMTCPELLDRLYLVNHAAKQIMTIKEQMNHGLEEAEADHPTAGA
jgi:hypothetical protein